MVIKCSKCDNLWIRLDLLRRWGCPKGHPGGITDLMLSENPDLKLVIYG